MSEINFITETTVKLNGKKVRDLDEDLRRLDISRLRLLVEKYPEKALQILRDLKLSTNP